MLMTGLRKIFQLGNLITISNREEKSHSIRNETFQSGNALSDSSAAWSLFLLLCKSGRYTVTSRSIYCHWWSPHGWSFGIIWLVSEAQFSESCCGHCVVLSIHRVSDLGGSQDPIWPNASSFSRGPGGKETHEMYMGVKAQPRVDTSYSLQPSTSCC